MQYAAKSEEITVLVRALADAQSKIKEQHEDILTLGVMLDAERNQRQAVAERKKRAEADIFRYVVEPLKSKVRDLEAKAAACCQHEDQDRP